ncbi:CPBP family intramembrane glutamic endopeptidase [Leuconostoc suionicum]|uniref:CPBP family intramembrane glutamic endopeptidase n=1 Tax=Leuconostoc suionicum TaxID=1511761 RepID=UPI00233F32A9|nr:CPBP family intramembrane glutamic endopeptidase [Leuconostoc suionicum]MDC2822618.1 CPBP family intramembrane metalloprotease [Leuconostoc suionicum]
MRNNYFKQLQRFFQFIYLFTILSLLLVYYFSTSKDFLINKIAFTVILIGTGFKFNFLDVDIKHLNIFIKKFKNNWLNCINFFVQFFIFVGLLTNRYPVYLFKYIGLTNKNSVLTISGLLVAVTLSTIMLISFVFTVTLPKIRGLFQCIVVSTGIMVVYLASFSLHNAIIGGLFGKIPYNLDFSLLSIIFVIIPIVYISLYNCQIKFPNFFKPTNKKYFLTLLPLLAIIFFIDSAIWLHPIATWSVPDISTIIFSLRAGIGEEFIYRIFIMFIFISVLNEHKYGPIYALIVQALLFGLCHLVNIFSGDPVISTIASTIDAFGIGILFGTLYLLTKNIGSVVIIHCLWDLMQSIVTGSGNMSVSGTEGFAITIFVMTICIVYSGYLISKNLTCFKSTNARYL